jgi:hypothetical protein
VQPEHVAQVPELHPALVGAAEGEGGLGGGVVHVLELGVGPENVEDGPVRFPQELERRQQQRRIPLRLGGVGRHGAEQDRLRRRRKGVLAVVLVVAAAAHRALCSLHSRRFDGEILGVHEGLGLSALLLGLLHEVPDHLLEAPGGLALRQIAVLVQPVLRLSAPEHLQAKIDVRDHDLLVGGAPRPVAAARQHLVQQREGGIVLVDPLELQGPPQRELGLVKERRGRHLS